MSTVSPSDSTYQEHSSATAQPSTAIAHVTPRLSAVGGPMLLELSIGIGMGLFGTAMAARVSDASAASFAIANHVVAMLFILFRIIGTGVGVVITQQLGAQARIQAQQTVLSALAAATWMGAGVAAALFILAKPLLGVMNAPANLLPLAIPFLQVLALLVLLDAWNVIMSGVLRAYLHNRQALIVVIVASVVQLITTPVLMFGITLFPGITIPAFGLMGFAYALALTRVITFVMQIMLLATHLNIRPTLIDWIKPDAYTLKPVLHIGLPAAAENIAYRLCFTVTVSVAGLSGAQSIAAQAYTLQLTYIALIFGIAIGFATEIVVGYMIGAGKLKQAHRLVLKSLTLGLCISVPATTIAALCAPWTMRLFTQDAQIIALGVTLMWWTVLLEPGRTFNLVVINALRATGDAKFPAAIGTGSMLILLALGSYVLAVPLGLGLVGVWIAYALDEWFRGLLMWRRWVRLDWVPHARRSMRQTKQQAQA